MSYDPPRHAPPERDDELKRLAAQGRARSKQVFAARPAKIDREDEAIRLALARVHMPPLRRAALAGAAVGALLVAGGLFVPSLAGAKLAVQVRALGLALLVGNVLASLAARRVTPAQLEAERAWVSGLPFRLDGYFKILAQPGEKACHLQAVVAWTPGAAPIDHGVVLDVWRAHDPAATSHRGPHGELGVETGPIVTQGWRRGRMLYRYGNAKIPPYVHRLVSDVLLPLHRRQALTRVSLARR